MRHLGGVSMLFLVGKSPIIYFQWQACVNAIFLFIFAISLRWRLKLPGGLSLKGSASFATLFTHLKFSSGVFFSTLISVAIIQYDKIVLPKFCSLTTFGYYSLAATIGTGLTFCLNSPLQNAFFPQLSRAFTKKDTTRFNDLYRLYSQAIASSLVTTCTVGFVLFPEFAFFFSKEPIAIELTSKVFKILIVGFCLHGLSQVCSTAFLAQGITRTLFYANLSIFCGFLPVIIYLSKFYSFLPTSYGWILINATYLLWFAPILHRGILNTRLSTWFFQTLLAPATIAWCIASITLRLLPSLFAFKLIALAATVAASVALSLLLTPLGRSIAKKGISSISILFRRHQPQ